MLGGVHLDRRVALLVGHEARPGRHRLGRELAVGGLVGPRIQDGHLVPARAAHPEVDEVRALPVAVEVDLVLEGQDLQELVAVVAVAVDVVARGAVADRHPRDLLQRLLERIAAKARGVPRDVHDAGHYAPTSARIAPGPSSVRPWPSSVAPTRIAILPRCLFSCMSWCACPTSSKGITCHSTGRILDSAMSLLALLHCHALAKCEPRI